MQKEEYNKNIYSSQAEEVSWILSIMTIRILYLMLRPDGGETTLL